MKEKAIPAQILNNIVNAAFIGLSIIMAPLVVSSIVRSLHFGWSNIYILNFSILLIVLAVTIFRNKISYHIKTHLLCFIFIINSFWNSYLYIFSGTFYMFLGAVVFSTLIYGRKMGIFYAAFSILGVMTINLLHINGAITSEVDYNIFNHSYNTWIATMVGLLIIILLIIYAVGKFYNYYIETISNLKDNTKLLEKSYTQLEIKENELELQNNELVHLNQQYLNEKEKAEESDLLKTSFLQNMSHEIRTPMNAIMGFSQLLAKNYNNKPKLEKYSIIINQRCNDLLDIINDILDIAKIESGQLPVNMEKCNLRELFSELTLFFTEYQGRTEKQHIKLQLQAFVNDPDAAIVTDKVKLKQIFINLINNSFKFTNEGKIEAGCKLYENKIIFYVTDTGIGIPADKYNLVFERFVQLYSEQNKNTGGTGLGLSIVKGFVKILGGEIRLESEVGVGTTFYFSLPYIKSEVINSVNNPAISEVPEYIFPNKMILIVEDDIFNAEYIKEILEGTQLIVLHAENGKEAVDLSIANPVDIILMDINLPDFSGYEATTQIKQSKPNVKIIIQTAYASNEEKQKALSFGCIDYISKPTSPELLLSTISKHLNSN